MGVLLQGVEVDVEIEDELQDYLHLFPAYRIRGNKLQSCSPFREETKPSFAVNLDNGTWIDSGSADDGYKQGNFIMLLALLKHTSYEDEESELAHRYATVFDDMEALTLNIKLPEQVQQYKVFERSILEPLSFRSPYLANRGISEQVQKAFKIGYDKDNTAISLPWMDNKGQIINIKFRDVNKKKFWYLQDGQPVKQFVYGLHFIYKMQCESAVVVESETDCLYLWTQGIPAVALGSAHLSKKQQQLLVASPLKELVLALDADKAGQDCKENMSSRLLGLMRLSEVKMPAGCKDINDIPANKVAEVVRGCAAIIPKVNIILK